jgi:glycosyltransferase involved in cell wall biosynthesis
LTAFQKQWAERNGLGVRTVQIPNGVDLEKFGRKVKPAKVALPRPVILCVAALEAGKRIDLTIRAVAGLKKGSLLVAGDGADKEKLLALGEKMLPGRFRILQAPHERTPAYYAAADLFTMVPVPCEAFGIVYLEAMAAGLPVVAPDDPIRREIVGRGGLYVNPESTEEYSRALDEALRVRWGDVPRRQAEKFSWDKIAVNYERLFRALIN